MDCDDVSNIFDDDIDDFYRYYFAWFEAYKCILEERWDKAEKIAENLDNFIPSLFQKQEVFWDKKLLALKKIISDQKYIEGYDFCRNLVPLKRRASELASFFAVVLCYLIYNIHLMINSFYNLIYSKPLSLYKYLYNLNALCLQTNKQ